MSIELTLVGMKKKYFVSKFLWVDRFIYESHFQFQVKQVKDYASELKLKSLNVFGSCKSESKFQNEKLFTRNKLIFFLEELYMISHQLFKP